MDEQVLVASAESRTGQAKDGVRATLALFEQGRAQIGRVISGQEEMIDQALLTVLCGGHALIEGLPGVAKTLTVKTLARFLALSLPAGAGHARHDARRHSGHERFLAAHQRVRAAQRPGLHAVSARRRDQPHAAAHAGGPARSHGRAAGHARRRNPPARRLLHRLCDPEPDRVRRHLPACPRRSSTAF